MPRKRNRGRAAPLENPVPAQGWMEKRLQIQRKHTASPDQSRRLGCPISRPAPVPSGPVRHHPTRTATHSSQESPLRKHSGENPGGTHHVRGMRRILADWRDHS